MSFAQELLKTYELSDERYASTRAILGDRGILDVVAVLGYYSMIAMTMKVFAMRPDPGVTDPFDFKS